MIREGCLGARYMDGCTRKGFGFAGLNLVTSRQSAGAIHIATWRRNLTADECENEIWSELALFDSSVWYAAEPATFGLEQNKFGAGNNSPAFTRATRH
jgi:hypothetical protein